MLQLPEIPNKSLCVILKKKSESFSQILMIKYLSSNKAKCLHIIYKSIFNVFIFESSNKIRLVSLNILIDLDEQDYRL